jgi:polyhydroxyalkanoate synthesis repressor PhaR
MGNMPAHKIRKYPNRRFYDLTSSRHITFEELYELVRGGGSIEVTDSATGEDITSAVLTHMILERDAPKLAMFSSGLLHQVIQSNQQILGSFVERYFNRALQAFLASQQQFDGFLKNAGVSPPPMLDPMQWARAFVPARELHGDQPEGGTNVAETPPPPPTADDAIARLAAQVQELSKRLGDLDRPAQERSKRRSASRTKTSSAHSKKAPRSRKR